MLRKTLKQKLAKMLMRIDKIVFFTVRPYSVPFHRNQTAQHGHDNQFPTENAVLLNTYYI